MRLCAAFVLTLSLLLAMPAAAAKLEAGEEVLLNNWNNLNKLLRSRGIETTRVDWAAIGPLCLGLKTETDQVAYNRCMFIKAVDTVIFKSDTNVCRSRASSDFPNSMLTSQTVVVTKYDNDASKTTTITYPTLSQDDLTAKRNDTYESCMSERGWRDTHNPLLGNGLDR